MSRDTPGGPVVKILPSIVGDTGLTPGGGNKIPYALWSKAQKADKKKTKKNRSNIITNSIKILKKQQKAKP